MITTLLELVRDLVLDYQAKGPSVLIEAASNPLFQRLADHLSKITMQQVGMTNDNHNEYFKQDTTTYFNIIEEPEFCIGVFCLGKGSCLNLHDHPNMLVLTKFLTGAIHHRSLDLFDRSQQVELPRLLIHEESPDVVGKELEAIVRSDKVFKSGDIHFLTPEKGNIHRYTALEDTAILDILLPNYNETTSFCNYYIEIPTKDQDEEKDPENGEKVKPKSHHEREAIIERLIKENEESSGKKCVDCDGLLGEVENPKYKKPGEKTTLIYILPPLEQQISLVPYQGEEFEFESLTVEMSEEKPNSNNNA